MGFLFASGSNPDDFNRVMNERSDLLCCVNDQAMIIQRLSDEKTELLNYCLQLQSQTQQRASENNALRAQNWNLVMAAKREQETKHKEPRRFHFSPSGSVECIKAGKEIIIAIQFLRPDEAEVIVINNRGRETSLIRVCYAYEIGQYTSSIVPIDKIMKSNLRQYFPQIRIGYSDAIANDALRYWLQEILSDPNIPYTYYSEYPGVYFEIENNAFKSAEFDCSDGHIDEQIEPYLSKNYRKKFLPHTERSAASIAEDIRPYFNNSETLIMLVFSLTGLLSTYLETVSLPFNTILTVAASDPDTEKTASCYLKTYHRLQPPRPLTMTKSELTEQLMNGNDETIVLWDNLSHEDGYRMKTAVEIIQTFETNENKKPFALAILSRNLHYYFPAGKVLHIEVSNLQKIDMSPDARKKMCGLMDEMNRYFIEEFCAHIKDYDRIVRSQIYALREKQLGLTTESGKMTFAVLYSVLNLWSSIFHFSISDSIGRDILNLVQQSENSQNGSAAAIVNAFFSELNAAISVGKLQVAEYGRDMQYRPNNNKVYLAGELMLIEENPFKTVLLPGIKIAGTVQSVLTALRSQGYLDANAGENRKAFTVYYQDQNRAPEQKSFIAFRYRDMLRTDVVNYFQSQKYQPYFTDETEIPGFIPLIENAAGSRAGQVHINNYNYHRFVTGKSGSGKTVFLMQLLYYLNQIGNRIVVFDTNHSFDRDALYESLPADFVDEHISFHNIEEQGIPINPFAIDSNDNLARRKNTIVSVLTATLHDLSEPQIAAIKKMTRTMLVESDQPNYTFFDVMVSFSEMQGISEKSITKRLESVFEDVVDSCEKDLTEKDWKAFLDECKEIVIISTGSLIGVSGNQMIDMMLASLLIYQQHNTDFRQMSIFIDEIQMQNLTKYGPIYAILREGRKYHMDLNYATQYVSSSNDNKLLRQAGVSIFFQPDSSSKASVAEILGLKKKEQYMLDELSPGKCIVKGDIYNHRTQLIEDVMICGQTLLAPDSPLQ